MWPRQLGLKEEDVTVQRHLAGRWLRAQIEVRLCPGSGDPVQGNGRNARESGVDARGRHPARASIIAVSYQHVTAGLDKNNKVVAWRHRSVSPSLMSNFMPDPKRESAAGAGPGADRHALQRAEPAAGDRRSRPRIPASAGSVRSTTFRTRSPCSPWWRSWRPSWARIRRTSCWR